MTDEDLKTVREFAAGNNDLREAATAVYQKYLRTDLESLPMQFMSEVLNPVPDLYLRHTYRKRLTEGHS